VLFGSPSSQTACTNICPKEIRVQCGVTALGIMVKSGYDIHYAISWDKILHELLVFREEYSQDQVGSNHIKDIILSLSLLQFLFLQGCLL